MLILSCSSTDLAPLISKAPGIKRIALLYDALKEEFAMPKTSPYDKAKTTGVEKKKMVASARKALAMKKSSARDGEGDATQPDSRTANEGMQPLPNSGIAPSGALQQEGHRPVLERSRKVR